MRDEPSVARGQQSTSRIARVNVTARQRARTSSRYGARSCNLLSNDVPLPLDIPKSHHVYCDESQTSGQRFVVYGGIILTANNAAAFDDVIEQWRATKNFRGELKWTKVSKAKYRDYRTIVDMFFEHVAGRYLHFKAMVCDRQDPAYRHQRSDREIGFYKLYYQFLLRKFAVYADGDEHRLYVFLDQRDTKYKLEVLKIILNRGIRKMYGRTADVVQAVEARDSKKCNVMQVADVIMGAIGFHNNDWHRQPGASKAKIELAKYVARKARLTSLKHRTAPRRVDFEIWIWQAKTERPDA
jgi:hypothetical protein